MNKSEHVCIIILAIRTIMHQELKKLITENLDESLRDERSMTMWKVEDCSQTGGGGGGGANGEKWRKMAMANSAFSFVKFAIFRQFLILEFHI